MFHNDVKLLDQDELKRLLQQPTGVCVSIFMPTHRVRLEKQREDQIRLKNLIRDAESQLAAFAPDLTVPEVQRLLEPAAKLLDDGLFWKQQEDGLALFLSEGFSRIYRLPLDLKKFVTAANRFHIKPLLPLLVGNGRFYILALSQNEVRLFQGARYHITEVDLGEILTSLAEAITDDDPERQLQFHTSTGASAAAGGRAAVFHGQGVQNETKSNLFRYFRQVDAGLQKLLVAKQAPLILACVDYLLPIYQRANTYAHLLSEGIYGNPETVSIKTLHQQAWEIAQPHFLQAQRDAVEQYGHLTHTDRASDDLTAIVNAAGMGRVDTLLVTMQSQTTPGAEEIADLAAGQTLLHGGDVFIVAPDDMPGEASIAAIFRY